jgi:hypothetical protein
MKVIQSPSFAQTVKKIHKNEKLVLDVQIKKILKELSIGQEKRGDLKNIFVYKFKITNKEYLISYRKKEENLELITLGLHENYYRDLKNI